MLFNSYIFMLVFLPAVLAAWWSLASKPLLRLSVLVFASYLFYGWNRWEYVILLAISTVVDYEVGRRMHREIKPWKRKFWLGTSLISNLGMLGYFKYSGFFAESLNAALMFLRTGDAIHVPQIALPIGISFYTFQTLTYSIDLYRREIRPATSLLHFAAYVSMFPQLIAGPIVRYKDIEAQMTNLACKLDWRQISLGIWFFVVGMSQKILVADTIAAAINPLLSDTTSLQFATAWFALLGYSIQLYFDFAGYSNMAVGLGFFLGFIFPTNFNSPYKAVNIQDFWRRWHITLSTFLRDYLYIPLGGNRYGRLLSLRNLLIVMLLGGLWHGAGWTFVLWGAYHGLLLVSYAIYRSQVSFQMHRPIATALTFFCVIFGWMLFRSLDLQMAEHWAAALIGLQGFGLQPESISYFSIFILTASLGVCWFAPNASQFQPKATLRSAIAVAGLLWFCILRFDAESPFLYFQF